MGEWVRKVTELVCVDVSVCVVCEREETESVCTYVCMYVCERDSIGMSIE